MNEEKQNMPEFKSVPIQPMSITDLVSRLEELVRFTLECEKKEFKEGVSFVEIYKQLTQIREAISILNQDQQDTLTLIENAMQSQTEQKPFELTKENQKLLDKVTNLQDICENAKERIYSSIQEQPEIEQQVKEELKQATASNKKKRIRRKGKFRRVGGKKGWMPT